MPPNRNAPSYSPSVSVSNMKSYWVPKVSEPKRSLVRPTSAVRLKICPAPGIVAPLPRSNCDVSSKIALLPPPRSSLPLNVSRFGDSTPLSNNVAAPPCWLFTYVTPASITPCSVTLPCARGDARRDACERAACHRQPPRLGPFHSCLLQSLLNICRCSMRMSTGVSAAPSQGPSTHTPSSKRNIAL